MAFGNPISEQTSGYHERSIQSYEDIGFRKSPMVKNHPSNLIDSVLSSFQEWKVINPYHVHVRRRNPVVKHFVKMSLQLYQVDYKSFLLDFKSLPTDENSVGNTGTRTYNPWTCHNAPSFPFYSNLVHENRGERVHLQCLTLSFLQFYLQMCRTKLQSLAMSTRCPVTTPWNSSRCARLSLHNWPVRNEDNPPILYLFPVWPVDLIPLTIHRAHRKFLETSSIHINI